MKQQKAQQEEGKPVTEAQDRESLDSNKSMDNRLVTAAHEQADKDMEADAELTASSPNDDLDEGETARLGEKTNLV